MINMSTFVNKIYHDFRLFKILSNIYDEPSSKKT